MILQAVKNLIVPDPRLCGAKRSPKWRYLRIEWLLNHAECAVCGCRKNLEVHHIVPFHADPSKELDKANLITLGERCPTGNHHFLYGHLGNWASWNSTVRADVEIWRQKIRSRPLRSHSA